MTPNPADWFDRIPKVELHLHLEGAIPYAALFELAQKYGGDPAIADAAALAQKFVYKDFSHFIETWVWKNQFLREYADFTFIAEAVARDLAAQNIRYAEVFYSPADFARHGLQVQPLTQAIRAGLARAEGVEVALVADLVRNYGPAQAERTLAQVAEAREYGVIGVTIGGSEQEYPPEPFGAVYAAARRLGLHTSAHAGEAAGAASIWGALEALRVERIGHGTRAYEDERLLAALAERRVPLEVCPLSNLRTGVVKSIEEHPVRRYFERGLRITINTDDPKMFGNTLAEEYRLLHERLGFSREEIVGLVLEAAEASWLPEERKRSLAAALRAELEAGATAG